MVGDHMGILCAVIFFIFLFSFFCFSIWMKKDEWLIEGWMMDAGWSLMITWWPLILCGCICIITFHVVHCNRRSEIARHIGIYMMMKGYVDAFLHQHIEMMSNAMMPWCHDAMMSWCHDAMMSWCHDVMMPWCHDAMMSWCHDAMMPSRHDAMMPWCHAAASIIILIFTGVGGAYGMTIDVCRLFTPLNYCHIEKKIKKERMLFFRTNL